MFIGFLLLCFGVFVGIVLAAWNTPYPSEPAPLHMPMAAVPKCSVDAVYYFQDQEVGQTRADVTLCNGATLRMHVALQPLPYKITMDAVVLVDGAFAPDHIPFDGLITLPAGVGADFHFRNLFLKFQIPGEGTNLNFTGYRF